MDCYQLIVRRLEVREFSERPVEREVMLKVLEAGRSAPSAMNRQPWHFILVDDRNLLSKLSEAAYSGRYVKDAAFAVLVYVDKLNRHREIDGGRAIQTMVLAAWALGLASCITTGIDKEAVNKLVKAPDSMELLAIISFGYPKRKLRGLKRRKPLDEIASHNVFGNKIKL